MNAVSTITRLREVIRLKHLSLSTETTYVGWVVRYMDAVVKMPQGLASEQKVEAFLTSLAKSDCSASTQNQAFNAILFLYRDVLGKPLSKVDAMRAKRPAHIRVAPSVGDVSKLLESVQDVHDYPTRLVVRMIYGCGLRVTEPLNLRVKDVLLSESRIIIRDAKGGKDRAVALPCSLVVEMQHQLRVAKVMWERDVRAGVPVQLPGRLGEKYPQSRFAWQWAFVFPSHKPCQHPRTGEVVRWRMHEANVQKCVRDAARKHGLAITPHVLRHAYATHALRQGANVRDIQDALGHAHINTTMGYLTATQCNVASPLEFIESSSAPAPAAVQTPA